jgi:SAM-dependent methyltransferase
MKDLDALYRFRFPEADRRKKDRVWQALCAGFFQRFVREGDAMLDLGCGYGEFSRYIKAGRKYAVDLNPESARFLPADVEFHQADARKLSFLESETVNVAFASNFFEHLPTKSVMDEVLAEVWRVLVPGGRFVVLQPNVRLVPGEYWDFYDHVLPLSDRSCAEAFGKAGYHVDELIPRFLPYTTRSRLPQHPFFVSAYLRLPFLWPFIGKQLLIVGSRPSR